MHRKLDFTVEMFLWYRKFILISSSDILCLQLYRTMDHLEWENLLWHSKMCKIMCFWIWITFNNAKKWYNIIIMVNYLFKKNYNLMVHMNKCNYLLYFTSKFYGNISCCLYATMRKYHSKSYPPNIKEKIWKLICQV